MKIINKLSIIIPVYNEEKTIKQLLERVLAVDLGKIKKEIIVVNDGSTDRTLDEIKKIKDIKLISYNKNIGKSSSLRTGFEQITGDVVVVQDGDMEYDPNDFKKLLRKMQTPGVQVVYGSRILGKRDINYSGLSFFVGGLALTKLVNFLYGAKITDEPTCYKMFETKLLQSLDLKSVRFEFCPEVTAKVLKKGIKIYEVPISYNPRHIDQGKKIRAADFVEAVWVLIRERVTV
ncbi:MAG: glycosyltransferase family 2 protein [Candidatus Shapirobacteria bacterium]